MATNNQTEGNSPNPETINEILKLMELSSMSQEERTMWTMMLPSMEQAELEKLRDTLAKEVQKMTDIYLQAKALPDKDPQQ